MSRKKILIHIIIGSISLLAIIIFICGLCIPRLDYVYNAETDSYVVTKAWGYDDEYFIPASHNGKPVTSIGVRAFYQHNDLVSVVFENPDNITKIERLAFAECPKLATIDLSKVYEIERNAFQYDVSLNNLNIGAKYIGAATFLGCSSLKNVNILDGNYSIGSEAFTKTALEELSLPSTTDKIYVDAFYGLDDLTIYVHNMKWKEDENLQEFNVIYFE